MAQRIGFVDIYVLYDDMDATIAEELLEEHNIDCIIRELDVADTVERHQRLGMRIAVEEEKKEQARRIIADAVRSGLISRQSIAETKDG